MEKESMHNEDMTSVNSKRTHRISRKRLYTLCTIAGIVLLVVLVYLFAFKNGNNKQDALYTQTESWNIPGGQGRCIVIKPEKVTEQDMYALGELLKQESTIYTNAFVYVYDNVDAAKLRKKVMEDKPSPEDALKHDAHFMGMFSKVGEQKNVFDVFLSGSRGNNNKRMTF